MRRNVPTPRQKLMSQEDKFLDELEEKEDKIENE